jgi:hypothetical protein
MSRRSHKVLACARSNRVEKKRCVLMMKDGLTERVYSMLERATRGSMAMNERAAAVTVTGVCRPGSVTKGSRES